VRAALEIDLNVVIVAVTDDRPRVLVVERPFAGNSSASSSVDLALPFGPLDPEGDRTLERGLRRWVDEQTGLGLGYVEQLYTFGDRDRYLQAVHSQRRRISVAYLALVREMETATERNAHWRDVYDFFPWEDWRAGRPSVIDRVILPRLKRWRELAGEIGDERGERMDIAFGLGEAGWDGDRVLDRYELLYEAGLVAEAIRDAAARAAQPMARRHETENIGRPMYLDHRRIVATAVGRLRGKIRYRPLVFELLPPRFTLLQLQRVVEALAGIRLHKQNFRRLVERGRLVEGTGRLQTETGGRPAELFSFRREAVRERPAPGVGFPGLRSIST
jgi:hypothetical protein